MKRAWVTLLIVLLALGMVGCGENHTTEEPNKNQEQDDNQNQDQDESQEQDQEVVIRPMGILDGKQKADQAGVLWYIPNETVEASLQQKIALFCNDLLLYGTRYDKAEGTIIELSRISLETGKTICTRRFSGIEMSGVQVCGEHVVVSDWSNGDVYVLNQALETENTYTREGHNNGAVYAGPDLKHLFYFSREQGICVKNLDSGEEKILLDNTTGLFPGGLCGYNVSVSYTDKNTQMSMSAVVDLEQGETYTFPFTGAFYGTECDGGIWFGSAFGESGTYYIGKDKSPYTFVLQEKGESANLISSPTRLLTNVHDSSGVSYLTLYEADGRYLSQCVLDMNGAALYFDPVWSQEAGGYFFVVTDSPGVDKLMFWDFSVPMSGHDLNLKPAEDGNSDAEDSEISSETYQKVEDLETKYGIDIKIGQQCLTEHNEYIMEIVTDSSDILAALEVLDHALASYPDGFMRQLQYGTQLKTEFHLVKDLKKQNIPTNGNGFSNFVGFASEAEGRNLIVLDIVSTGSLEQTIYHEITHIVENKLQFDARIREDALFSEEKWNSLNPAGFAYAEDYHNIPESFYDDGFGGYFIDIYSRTYGKEDRARIMEYAMINAHWAFASEGRSEKLEYFSRCIRDAFDTSGWPDVTCWEKAIQK